MCLFKAPQNLAFYWKNSQLFYVIIIVNIISSRLVIHIKKPCPPHVAWLCSLPITGQELFVSRIKEAESEYMSVHLGHLQYLNCKCVADVMEACHVVQVLLCGFSQIPC